MKSKIVAIIPARGGSKRIPRKNIKDFLGKPIVAYSIEAALKSGCFDEVMVSTEDDEIAEIAKFYGAQVPFMRSTKTAGDLAMTADVLKEVILEYKKIGKNFVNFCCIFPTAPFISSKRIREGVLLLEKNDKADSVLPVTRFSYPIQRALKIKDGNLIMFQPENFLKRSQDLEPAYHDCGQFFCSKVTSLFEDKLNYSGLTIPIEVPESEVQDIDNEEDWKIAEMKYKMIKNI